MNIRHLHSTLLAALCIAMLPCSQSLADVNPKPFVVPELTSWTGAEGQTALSGRIIVKNQKLKGVAETFAADYKEMFSHQLSVAKGSARDGDIVLCMKADKTLGTEGYRMTVGRTVLIEAQTVQGAFWATRTLLQMSEQNADRLLPRGTTVDVPSYGLRGFMIDCGRKYIPMSYLRSLAKIMAYYKMNTLQVHLNDNGFRQFFDNDWSKTQAAFRLECDTYPGLTAKDGSYTKQEFIDFEKLAEANCVEVIPEIDAPAHALAFTQYRPELGSEKYGMDHFDLFNPDVYTFMDALWSEYLSGRNPVFCGPRVHIGTDEYSNADQKVVEKFRAYTDHYIHYVENYGKQAMLWGALTHAKGETKVKSDNVVMACWYNGYADPKEMKRQGYQIVSIPDGLVYIVPAAGYYYDYLNCQYLYENWTPAIIGNQTFDDDDAAILGGMFAVWNDHAGNGITVKDIHHRFYPALQTLSVKCWTGRKTSLPYADFDRQRTLLSEAPGVNELARHGLPGTTVLQLSGVEPGMKFGIDEIGYSYEVSFTIDGAEEEKGAELSRSANAVFYLSDPIDGKLGFEREGYLNTFNYRIEKGSRHTLSIKGDNLSTSLYVDGKLRERLAPLPLYVMADKDRAHFQTPSASAYEPVVYNPKSKITYQRTLVFPLNQAGNFRSTITQLSVKAE